MCVCAPSSGGVCEPSAGAETVLDESIFALFIKAAQKRVCASPSATSGRGTNRNSDGFFPRGGVGPQQGATGRFPLSEVAQTSLSLLFRPLAVDCDCVTPLRRHANANVPKPTL